MHFSCFHIGIEYSPAKDVCEMIQIDYLQFCSG